MVFVTGGAFTLRAREFLENVPNAAARQAVRRRGARGARSLANRQRDARVGHARVLRRARREDALLASPRRLFAESGPPARAAELGYDALGVADCDGLYGMVRALEAAEEAGVRLVIGSEVAIDGPEPGRIWLHVASIDGLPEPLPHPDGEPRALPERPGAQAGEPGRAQPVRGDPRRADVRAGRGALVPLPSRRNEERDAGSQRRSARGSRCSRGGTSTARTGLASRGWRRWRERSAPPCARRIACSIANRRDKPVFDVLHCIREGHLARRGGQGALAEYRGAPQVTRRDGTHLRRASRVARALGRGGRRMPILAARAQVPFSQRTRRREARRGPGDGSRSTGERAARRPTRGCAASRTRGRARAIRAASRTPSAPRSRRSSVWSPGSRSRRTS